MAGVESRLNRFIEKALVACGHDELVNRAGRARQRLEGFIEAEVEQLARKAGVS